MILLLLIPSVNCTRIDKKEEENDVVLSSEDADLILERFYVIEQEYLGIEKIKKQIEALDECIVFSNDDLLNNFLKTIQLFNNSNQIKSKNNGVFIGPTIISHFIPRGRIIGTSLNRSWYYDGNFIEKNLTGLMSGKVLEGVLGALPVYIGGTLNPVFITAIRISRSDFYSTVFFPFFEIMIPCIGFSIRVKNESGTIIFEYNLDFCLFAIFKGLSLKHLKPNR